MVLLPLYTATSGCKETEKALEFMFLDDIRKDVSASHGSKNS
jgi:hypothetical protein